MKIVADENMPLAESLFSPFGEVRLLPGREMTGETIGDADLLLVRSVTPVNSSLLAASRVRFVGSATIGTDHVDLPWLQEQGIAFANAPGCNAHAVVNYVLAALSRLDGRWPDKTVGIVGCGNVGGALYRALKAFGVRCRCHDPFLTGADQPDLCEFGEVIRADILCLHTPLTRDGPHPTFHLFDDRVLRALKPGTVLLNAGRGAVVDNRALKAVLAEGRISAVLDVWENEPGIDTELLERVALGTPHIAGYSLEGRIRGTAMVYEAFCRWLGAPVKPVDVPRAADRLAGAPAEARVIVPGETAVTDRILAAYDPAEDDRRLKSGRKGESLARRFDRLRKDYPLRREFGISFKP